MMVPSWPRNSIQIKKTTKDTNDTKDTNYTPSKRRNSRRGANASFSYSLEFSWAR